MKTKESNDSHSMRKSKTSLIEVEATLLISTVLLSLSAAGLFVFYVVSL